jgi:hypothetical protein
VIHACGDRLQRSFDSKVKRRRRFSESSCREAIVLAKKRRAEAKKRHVETLTRLPTKCLATACWDFIVAKSTLRETAPMLDFFSLQGTNSKMFQQFIHKLLWISWG